MKEQNRLLIEPTKLEVLHGYVYGMGRDTAEGRIFVYNFTLHSDLEGAEKIEDSWNGPGRKGLALVGLGIHIEGSRINKRVFRDPYHLGLWVETVRVGLQDWPIPDSFRRNQDV